MSENTSSSSPKTLLSVLITALKIIFLMPIFLVFTAAALWLLFESAGFAVAFMGASVFPAAFIMKNICVALSASCLALLIMRIIFSHRLSGLRFSTIGFIFLTLCVGGGIFNAIDAVQTDNFRWADYPGYIEEWDTNILYQTVDCTYTDRPVRFEGYFSFITGGFRETAKIEIKDEPSLTDSYRIEVYYKGLPAELNIYSDKDCESISVWLTDYDYSLTAKDYVYMYENSQNLEYAEPLAIEKIIIYTAYPHLIDTDGINW